MVVVIDGALQLSNEFISCNGETKPVGEEGREWWIETCELHGYEYEFTPATYSQEVLDRFEEVKNINPKYIFAIEMYVRDGFVSPEIDLLVENIKLKSLLSDLTEVVLLGGV